MDVRVTPSVGNTFPTLTVMWRGLASGAANYTVKYSTEPGEVNIPPEGALEVTGISGTSTILTALERGTTYYIWVVGVSEGGERPYSDRMSGVTYDSELGTPVAANKKLYVNNNMSYPTYILYCFYQYEIVAKQTGKQKYVATTTVWPEILAGNLFWRIGGFESNPPIFHPPKTSQCDVIIIVKS